MNSNFQNNLKKIRKENGLSQEELADKMGVSRQSVSKWESGQAYPEMDKVLELCNMFNLNVDELLNKNIEEVRESKESKNKVNKFIDSFLNYITKTVEMFTNMKTSQKFKCLFEEFITFVIILIACLIFNDIFNTIMNKFTAFLPYKVGNVISSIFDGLFYIVLIIFAIIIFINLFKIRYLDYYKVVSKEEILNVKNESNEKLEIKDNTKIIIRDPANSEYKFINGLAKACMFLIKLICACILIGVSCLLIGEVFTLILSIINIVVHKIIIGIIIGIIACIVITYILIDLFYSFIFNKKFRTKINFVLFIISLLIGGVSLAFIFNEALKIDYVELENDDTYNYTIEMNNDLKISSSDFIDQYEFVIDDNNDYVNVSYEYNKEIYELSESLEGTSLYIIMNYKIDNTKDSINYLRNNLKENKFVSSFNPSNKITISSSKKNIKKLIDNMSNKRITSLTQTTKGYMLNINDYYEIDDIICSKDGFYNNCIAVSGIDSDDMEDVTYDGEKLSYDKNTYSCTLDDKEYNCYIITDDEE